MPPPPVVVPLSPPLTIDSVPLWERPNGTLLRPGALTYRLSLIKPDSQIVALGTRTVNVSELVMGGAAAWLIAESRTGTPVPTSDSVFLTHNDLSPERWVATIGTAQMAASFTADSIFGAVQNYQGRASFAVALPKGTFLSTGMTERVIEMLPLRMGYRAAASLMLIEGNTPRMEPATIEVIRENQMNFGGRSVDCWIVVLRTGAIEQRLWVSKESPRVLSIEQALANGLYSAELQP